MPLTSRAGPVPRHGDRDGANLALTQLLGRFSRLQIIWADATGGWLRSVVKRKPDTHHFAVLPRRWVVGARPGPAEPMPTVEQRL